MKHSSCADRDTDSALLAFGLAPMSVVAVDGSVITFAKMA